MFIRLCWYTGCYRDILSHQSRYKIQAVLVSIFPVQHRNRAVAKNQAPCWIFHQGVKIQRGIFLHLERASNSMWSFPTCTNKYLFVSWGSSDSLHGLCNSSSYCSVESQGLISIPLLGWARKDSHFSCGYKKYKSVLKCWEKVWERWWIWDHPLTLQKCWHESPCSGLCASIDKGVMWNSIFILD